jgi:hypothetical protein
MKTFFLLIAAGSSLFLAGCGSAGDHTPVTTEDSITAPAVDTIQPGAAEINRQPYNNDSVFTISFSDTNQQIIRTRLGSRGPAILCNFSIAKPQSLSAIIIPDKADCNIRISQIVMPGGKTDGPFGRELTYKLSRKGTYQLIIDHNMMAGDPEVCDFSLRVTVK